MTEVPRNTEAEAAVLSCCLRDPSKRDTVAFHPLSEQLWYHPAHRIIWQHMRQLTNLDLLTLNQSLTESGDLEKVGGPAAVAELMDAAPTVTLLDAYLTRAVKSAEKRGYWQLAQSIQADIYDCEKTTEDIRREIDETIRYLSQAESLGHGRNWREVVRDTVEQIQENFDAYSNNETTSAGIPTEYPKLNELIGGWVAGEMIVIAARPGAGKTALGTCICAHLAKQGKRILIFSAEMQDTQLCYRTLSASARINSRDLRSGQIGANQFPKLLDAAGKESQWSIYIDDRPWITIEDIEIQLRNRMMSDAPPDFVFIDYIQEVSTKKEFRGDERKKVQHVSRCIRNLAKEHNVPILALAQLRKDTEGREPKKSDIMESGKIEQDAHVIGLLHTDPDEEQQITKQVTLKIAKVRNGQTGNVPLLFEAPYTHFKENTSTVIRDYGKKE